MTYYTGYRTLRCISVQYVAMSGREAQPCLTSATWLLCVTKQKYSYYFLANSGLKYFIIIINIYYCIVYGLDFTNLIKYAL